MSCLPLTMAVELYDRHVPFFEGTVKPKDVDLTVIHVGQVTPSRHGRNRHERMIRDGEFDVVEVSLSSYLMAVSAIHTPYDLVGKKIGLNSFQTTLSVLAKGDLQEEYDVPWRAIGEMVGRGELDAVILPHPPRSVLHGGGVRRLFADPRLETVRYFRKNGYYPIMHVIALKADLAAERPWVADALMEAFARAWAVATEYYDDPNWSRLAWARHLLEEERAQLGEDLWPNGIARNRANLERFIRYSHDQGLIKSPMPVESLFVESTRGT